MDDLCRTGSSPHQSSSVIISHQSPVTNPHQSSSIFINRHSPIINHQSSIINHQSSQSSPQSSTGATVVHSRPQSSTVVNSRPQSSTVVNSRQQSSTVVNSRQVSHQSSVLNPHQSSSILVSPITNHQSSIIITILTNGDRNHVQPNLVEEQRPCTKTSTEQSAERQSANEKIQHGKSPSQRRVNTKDSAIEAKEARLTSNQVAHLSWADRDQMRRIVRGQCGRTGREDSEGGQ